VAKHRTSEVERGVEPASQDDHVVPAAARGPYALIEAQWRGFQRLARTLPNRRVLSIELRRTAEDEAAAIFTVASEGQPMRYVVTRDTRGRVVGRVDGGPENADAPAAPPAIIAAALDLMAEAFDREPPEEPRT
jgi:hypothetical protein